MRNSWVWGIQKAVGPNGDSDGAPIMLSHCTLAGLEGLEFRPQCVHVCVSQAERGAWPSHTCRLAQCHSGLDYLRQLLSATSTLNLKHTLRGLMSKFKGVWQLIKNVFPSLWLPLFSSQISNWPEAVGLSEAMGQGRAGQGRAGVGPGGVAECIYFSSGQDSEVCRLHGSEAVSTLAWLHLAWASARQDSGSLKMSFPWKGVSCDYHLNDYYLNYSMIRM
jgi:hypothetical protein